MTLLASVAASGSACVPNADEGTPCNDDSACPSDEICSDGLCARFTPDDPPRDAGRSDDAGPSIDGGAPDAGLADAGRTDAGLADAGLTDAGAVDAGVTDAGVNDAGVADAGVTDAGVTDAGVTDAGAPTTSLRVQVTAGTGVPAGYAVAVTIDHAALIAGTGATTDGVGLRVRERGTNSDVPVVKDPDSAWNQHDTRIWFRLASALSEGQSATYTVEPPFSLVVAGYDFDDVFLAGDDFDDDTLSPRFTAFTNLGATVTETGGGLVFDMGDDQAEAAIVSAVSSLPEDRRFSIRQRMRLDSVAGDDTSYNVKTMAIVQWEQQPSYAPTNLYGENRRQRIVINQGIDGKSWVYFQDASNTRWCWTESGWVTGYVPWGTLPFGVDHQHAIESDGDSFVLVIQSADGVDIVRTDPVPWSNVFVRTAPQGNDVSTGPFWFYWGEVYVTGEPLPDGGVAGGPYYVADFRTNWVMMRPFVSPEPVAEVIAP